MSQLHSSDKTAEQAQRIAAQAAEWIVRLDDQPDEQTLKAYTEKQKRDEEQKKLLNRLCRIEGQVRGLQEMLKSDAYCPDILVQVSAVSAALNSFSKELLASHIRTCVADGIRQGDDEVIDELVTTLQKLMK